MLLACHGNVSVSAVFLELVGCVFVGGICRCESGMCKVIVWLIISALTTIRSATTVQGQEGHHFGRTSDINYAHSAH